MILMIFLKIFDGSRYDLVFVFGMALNTQGVPVVELVCQKLTMVENVSIMYKVKPKLSK